MNTNKKKTSIYSLFSIYSSSFLYGLIFYLFVYFFPPCRNYFSNSALLCLDPCLIYNHTFSMWEMIVHQLFSSIVIIVFIVLVYLFVFYGKNMER